MVRFALSKTEMYIPAQEVENPIIIYHGGKDGLVLENFVKELVRLLREHNCRPRLVRIHDADHNSVMSDFDNLTNKVMRSSLFGEADETGQCLNFSSLLETGFDRCLTNRAQKNTLPLCVPRLCIRGSRWIIKGLAHTPYSRTVCHLYFVYTLVVAYQYLLPTDTILLLLVALYCGSAMPLL
jgi:hypothetical protein